jgi:hypothetical protein
MFKKPLLLILFSFFSIVCLAQEKKPYQTFTIKASVDSFQVKESNYTYPKVGITNSNYKDTSGFNTSLYSNSVIIKTDIDSVRITFNPALKPYAQITQINIITPHFKKIVFYGYKPMRNEFSVAYMDSVKNKPQFEIPEVYELANVLYALTNSSYGNTVRIFKNTDYYKQVQVWFSKYKNHPLIAKLEFGADKSGTMDYYNFRENSFCYTFKGNKIVRNNMYNIVWGEMSDNMFEKYLPLINDFVKKSNFRNFYQNNRPYYDSLIIKERQEMPVEKMWGWLQNNFTNKMHSYKVIFSPLILGTHSTQNFNWIRDNKSGGWFYESVMFISSTEPIDQQKDISNEQKEALASGIVFTEIDHNYCNPVSDRYRNQIDSAISNREKWISIDGDGNIYESAESVFNEYITHAVYVLYCYDMFKNVKDFEFIKTSRENLMVRYRKYIQFKEFDEALLDLYKSKAKTISISDLYPSILKWCKSHN